VIFFLLAAGPAAGVVAPELQGWLDRAELVLTAEVASNLSYDSGRAHVAKLRIDRVLKGTYGESHVTIVDLRPAAFLPPMFAPGRYTLTFLAPLKTNTYMEKHLPRATYFHALEPRERWMGGGSHADLAAMADLVARIAAANRAPAKDKSARAPEARALVFDLIAARHPTLVGEGVASLGEIPGLAGNLTDDERTRLETALDREDLPVRVRTELVKAIAAAGLKQLVAALRKSRSPRLTAACWDALAALGAPVTVTELDPFLKSSDPEWRRLAIRPLLQREGEAGIARVGDLALHDGATAVRRTAIEALGATKLPAALPTLERAYADREFEIRQAAAGAIITIGGRPAAETLTRLAFDGPQDGQRLAVIGLFTLGIDKSDPLMRRIAEEHPEKELRELAKRGLEVKRR
jgi:HEAT repeat protein